MFDYKEVIADELKEIKYSESKDFKVNQCTKKSFLVSNQDICMAYLAKWYLDKHIDFPVGLEFLRKPFEVIEQHTDYDADLATFKTRFYSSYSGIHSVFWLKKDNTQETKYTKWFLYKTIISCYNIVSTIFVRAKLDLIYTDINLYYILFTSEHSYEISVSLLDIFTRYGFITDEVFQKLMKRAFRKSRKKEEKQIEEVPVFQG